TRARLQASRDSDQLPRLDHRRIDQRLQRTLYGAVAEAVENALQRIGGGAIGSFLRAVQEGTSFDGMRDVSLFFQPPQHGADGGVLQLAPHHVAHGGCSHLLTGPQYRQQFMFQIAQRRQLVAHFRYPPSHVTVCNTYRERAQRRDAMNRHYITAALHSLSRSPAYTLI